MSFPSAWDVIKQYNGFLLSGPILLVMSVASWVAWVRSRREPGAASGRQGKWNLLAVAIVTTIIGLAHLFGIYGSVLNAWRIRSVDPSHVAALRIEKMVREGVRENKPPVMVTDTVVIREGLAKLAVADSRSRNHEGFSDGYRIELLLAGAAPARRYFLSVYRSSDRSGPITVVIPHIGPESAGTFNHGGEYSCPAFAEWVSRHVDPLFVNRS